MHPLNNVLAAVDLVTALVVGGLSVPLASGKVVMNHSYGFRFKVAFESAELWERINRYGGRQMLACSAVLALLALSIPFLPLEPGRGGWFFLVLALPLILVIPAFTTWRYAHSLSRPLDGPGA